MSQESESENDFESADEGETETSIKLSDVHSSDQSLGTSDTQNKSDVLSHLKLDKEEVKESSPCVNKPTDNKEKRDIKPAVIEEKCDIKPAVIEEKPSNKTTTTTQDVKELPQKEERVLLLKERKELERASRTIVPPAKDTKLSVQPSEEKTTSPGWGLVGGWSSSFLSSVASSASTFTSHVTQGIGTVLETVEATLGAPSPEELAAQNPKTPKTDEQVQPQAREEESGLADTANLEGAHAVGGLLGGVSAFTRVLETTGSKVITGGLDTLELIGKKTMDILTEGDPGLRKKRNIFGSGTDATLSRVLRDAKAKYEERNNASEESPDDSSLICYSKIFDDNKGLVHLEALEILSGRSKAQLEEHLLVLGPNADPVHATLRELRTTCLDLPPTDDTPDDEATQDFEKLVNEHMSALPLNLNIDKIKAVQAGSRSWVNVCKSEQDKGIARDAKEIYEKIITSLAELTARSMELFHKMSELVLVTGGDLVDLQSFAQHFTGLTAVLCTEIGILTSQFCQCLSTAADDSEDPDAINPLITNVYLEASNSNTYIQDAFQLLIPVFQELAVRK